MTSFKALVWDDWNIAHIARHSVTKDEVEEVVLGEVQWSWTYGGRIRLIGPTQAEQMLTVILAPKQEGNYYPVTARPASRSERRRYTQWKGGEQAA